MQPREESELTSGDLAKPMLRLAWPIVVLQLLQVAYNLADTVWLGAYSTAAVGALSLAFPLIFFLISVGGGFTAAGSILVAQRTGAGDDRGAELVAGQTLAFVGIVAVLLGALGFALVDPMLSLLPADAETKAVVIPMAADYMRVFFLGTPFLFGFFVFTSLMRGYGDTRAPMRVMLASVVLNVVLDPLVIFGWGPIPELGITGAAVATVGSRMLATALGLYVLFRTDAGPTITRPDLRLRLEPVREIVRLGVPSALEQSASSLAMITLTAMIATFPPAVVAAYGLGNRLSSLVFLPAMGLGQATNTIVGQNLGAERPDRAGSAVRLAGLAVAAVMVVLSVVAFLVPTQLAGAFVSTGTQQAAETVAYAADYLRVMAVMFVFMGVLQVALGAFRGAGKTRTSLAFSLVALWFVRVPATYYLVFVADWGAMGIWTAVALGDVIGCLAALAWLARGTWKNADVRDVDTHPAD